MEERKVRYVKTGRVVRTIKIPEGVNVINEDKLYTIIDTIMQKQSDSQNRINMTKKDFKVIIYDKVIEVFKQNKYFYKGLNLNIILKQVNRLLVKYQFREEDIVTKMTEEEEYDKLCWLIANKMDYSKKRYHDLKKKIFGED